MSTFKVIAGDFGQDRVGQLFWGPLYGKNQGLQMPINGASFRTEHVGGGEIASLEIATEQNLKKMSGSIGWGLVGGVAFGVVGAAAGVLSGGRKTEIVFTCLLSDGRRFLGKCDAKTFTNLQALAMSQPVSVSQNSSRPQSSGKFTPRKTEYVPSADLRTACLEGRHYACGSQECSCGCHAPAGSKEKTAYEAKKLGISPLKFRLIECGVALAIIAVFIGIVLYILR